MIPTEPWVPCQSPEKSSLNICIVEKINKKRHSEGEQLLGILDKKLVGATPGCECGDSNPDDQVCVSLSKSQAPSQFHDRFHPPTSYMTTSRYFLANKKRLNFLFIRKPIRFLTNDLNYVRIAADHDNMFSCLCFFTILSYLTSISLVKYLFHTRS